MARQLRSRASRPNYAVLSGYQDLDDDGAGPSNAREYIEEDDSGSEFELDTAHDQQAQDDAEDVALEEPEDEPEDAADSTPATSRRRGKAAARQSSLAGLESASVGRRRKSAAPKTPAKRSATAAPGLTHPSNRQQHALPSYHHRHRSVGIHQKGGKTERLVKAPELFEPESTALTTAWGVNNVVTDRVNKSWGYNSGPGPLWDMIEDRGWFKEACSSPATTEAERWPRVYERLPLGDYQVLDAT